MIPTLLYLRGCPRVRDNPLLETARREGMTAVLVAVLPAEPFRAGPHGYAAWSPVRYRFFVESLGQLRQGLANQGQHLLVRPGPAPECLPALAEAAGADGAIWLSGRTPADCHDDEQLRSALAERGLRSRLLQPDWLLHPESLPFPIEQVPEPFAVFRNEVASHLHIRSPSGSTPPPPPPPELPAPGELPSVAHLPAAAVPIGEAGARERLRQLAADRQVLHYEDARNRLDSPHDSTRLGIYLTHGLLSSRQAYDSLRRQAARRQGAHLFPLFQRDFLLRLYFHLLARKHGERLSQLGGILELELSYDTPGSAQNQRAWDRAETGFPLVDALLRCLAATGFLPFRGRLLLAHFFCNHLGLDWRLGAASMGAHLADFDPALCFGSFGVVAGVHEYRRHFRYLDLHWQAERYDPNASFVREWVPEIARLPRAFVFKPWTMSPRAQRRHGLVIGQDYPAPVVDLAASLEDSRLRLKRALQAAELKEGKPLIRRFIQRH